LALDEEIQLGVLGEGGKSSSKPPLLERRKLRTRTGGQADGDRKTPPRRH
jgi:hypothetical protein